MNICFYRYSLMNRGGDRMVIEYANYLAEIGHNVTIFTSQDETVFSVSPSVQRIRVPWKGQFGYLLYTLTHKLLFDVVIVDIIHLAPLVRCSGKFVYFAQANDVEYYGNPLQRRFIDFLYRRFFSRHGHCITVSECLSETFFNRYGAFKCLTVVNGIDLETFFLQPDPELLVQKNGRVSVFFMARGDRYRKGYDLALNVFKRLSETVPEKIELWVCGDRLEGVYSFPVKHFGVVDDARLRQILSSADLFFYPSRHEGFGLFPLEAMACGSVVVTTDAVPYARRYPCIHTAEIGKVDEMLAIFQKLMLAPVQIEQDRQSGFEVAALFDIKRSKEAFAQGLHGLVG